jgi:galactan 5-O-arabinofuranosyltransferase
MHLAVAGPSGTRRTGLGARMRAGLRARGGVGAAPAGPLRGAWRIPFAEVGIVLLVGTITAFACDRAIKGVSFDGRFSVARGFGPVWAAAMVALAVLAHVVQRRTGVVRGRMLVAGLAGIAAGLVMTPLMAGLNHTLQPPNTIFGGDMAFRTENVTRFATTWHLDDYTFRGLHAFYPPGWFWVAGRLAHVLDVTPWHIVKPFTIFTIGASLTLSFILWRMVLRPAGALSAAVGSLLVLPAEHGSLAFSTQAWYSPYSCFVAVTGVAWLAATVTTVRGGGGRWRLAFLAVVGAGLALTYYLLFIILVLVLLALVLIPREGRRPALLRAGAVVGAVAVLTAVFWVPLLSSLASGAASQGHFLNQHLLRVSVGLGEEPGLSVLAVAVIVALVLTFSSRLSQAMAALLAGTILYQLISVGTLTFLHSQLQPHRAVTMMWVTYGATVPVVLENLFDRRGATRWLAAPGLRLAAVAVVAIALPATFLLGAEQGADLAGGPFTKAALRRPVALGQLNRMTTFITQASGKRPQDLTVLTGDTHLLITRPYFGFLPLRARYAHPEADIPGRVAVLRAASACATPACTTRTLTSSRFGRVDVLVLSRTPFGFRVHAQEDGFPKTHGVNVEFRRGSFAKATWARRAFGGYTVFVRRPGQPA